jgi:ATP-dependent DNA helicase RecG
MDVVVLNRFLSEGESRFTEYKERYTASILKTVSAFANFHDGRILIGVSDDGSAIGLEEPRRTRLDLENAVNDNITPRPYFEMEQVDFEGRTILVVKVFKGEATPYCLHGKAYVRNDTSSVEADRSTLHRLILAGTHSVFEVQPAQEQELFFQELEKKFKSVLKVGRLTEDLFRTLELKQNGRFTNAAALLSDQNPVAGATLELVAYQGTSMDAEDRLSLEKTSVLAQFEGAVGYFRKHVRSSITVQNTKREDFEEIPLAAFREAVANAIVHRDYLSKGAVRIEFFPDRVEIVSPGTLPEGISAEEYRSGRLSVLRNRILADVFFRLDLLEKPATGVRRIKEQYRGRAVQPVFEVSANAIMVVLPRSKAHGEGEGAETDAGGKTNREEGITEQMKAILERLGTVSEVSRAEAQELLGLGKTRTYGILDELKRRRRIGQVGEGRSTRYRLL